MSRHRTGTWVMAALLFLGVALWQTSATWLQSAPSIIGGGSEPDWRGTLWTYWWTGYALTHGLNPFHATLNFFPLGQSPVSQYNLVDALLAWPLLQLFGPGVGYNIAAVVILTSTGLGAYGLVRMLGSSTGAGLVAGLALMTSNYLALEVENGRLTQAILLPLMLTAGGLARMSRGEGSRRLAIGVGLGFALTALTYWYYGAFLVIVAVVLWAPELRRLDRARLSRLALAAAITTALCLPPVLALARHYSELPGVGRQAESWMIERGIDSYDLGRATFDGLWPGWPLWWGSGDVDDRRISLGLIALAALGVQRRARSGRWLFLIATGYVLALGPYLRSQDGGLTMFPLPYLFLHKTVPFFDRMWWPARAVPVAYLGLLVLAACGVDRLAGRISKRWALPLAFGLVLADLPWRNERLPLSSKPGEIVETGFYDQLDGALITLPVLGVKVEGQEPTSEHHRLWAQSWHHLPILGGLGDGVPGHSPTAYVRYIESNALLTELHQISNGGAPVTMIPPEAIQQLRDDGFRWVVLDTREFDPSSRSRWSAAYRHALDELFGRATLDRRDITAWRLVVPARPMRLQVIRQPQRPPPSHQLNGRAPPASRRPAPPGPR